MEWIRVAFYSRVGLGGQERAAPSGQLSPPTHTHTLSCLLLESSAGQQTQVRLSVGSLEVCGHKVAGR